MRQMNHIDDFHNINEIEFQKQKRKKKSNQNI